MLSPYLPLASGEGDVDETAGVLETLESTALGDLGLLLGLNLFPWWLASSSRRAKKNRRAAGGESCEPWGSET